MQVVEIEMVPIMWALVPLQILVILIALDVFLLAAGDQVLIIMDIVLVTQW